MTKPQKSKHNESSLFLCCFGSFSHEETPMRESAFSWRRLRKKSDTKTVPLDASLPDDDKERRRAHRDHSRKWRWRVFKSTLKSKSNTQKPLTQSQAPAANPQPPRQRPPGVVLVPVTPNQTLPQTRPRERAQQNLAENEIGLTRVSSPEEEAREESSADPAVPNSASLPASKRRQSRPSSSISKQRQTTWNRTVRSGKARRYDSAFGLSAVLVTLVIMLVWGRLCAVLCTSAWLYLFPRIRMASENDTGKNSNADSKGLDLDSEVYKKKVILEGLLERNHRARHENLGN